MGRRWWDADTQIFYVHPFFRLGNELADVEAG
jgi:hypothetical protein